MLERFHINRVLLIYKAFYLLYFGGLACLAPFLPLYWAARNLTAGEIGIIASVRPFISFLGSPALTALADVTRQHKAVLVSTHVLSVLLRVMIWWLPEGTSFYLLTLVVFIGEFLGSAVNSLVDNSVLEKLGPGKEGEYGKQRLWGAVGWGLAALAIGSYVTHVGSLAPLFYTHAFVEFWVTLLCLKMPIMPPAETKASKVPLWAGLRVLLSHGPVVIFFFVVFVLGAGMGLIVTFLVLHLRDLGGTETLFGLTLLMTCVMELPMFFWAGFLIEKLTAMGVIALAIVTYILRFFWYASLWDPWWVLPAELMHGITYAAMWSACIAYAQSVAPPGLGATTQGILAGVHWGLGCGVGTVVGGFVYGAVGGAKLFEYSGISACVTLVLFLFTIYLQRTRFAGKSGGPVYATLQAQEALHLHTQPTHTLGEFEAEEHSQEFCELQEVDLRASIDIPPPQPKT